MTRRGVAEAGMRARAGARYGAIFAALYSVYALGLYLLRGAEPFRRDGTTIGAVILAYVFGGVVAGAVVGALQPLIRFRVGAMLVFGIAAFFVFAGIGVAADGLRRIDWLNCVILGAAFGVIGAFFWRGMLT